LVLILKPKKDSATAFFVKPQLRGKQLRIAATLGFSDSCGTLPEVCYAGAMLLDEVGFPDFKGSGLLDIQIKEGIWFNKWKLFK
jgi:hypothetical protein